MFLEKLELYGFKSFAARTVIPFGGELTAVVGPNGCGKSNIADAVQWVLGEQSAKSLRGTGMTDVIFSGTEKRKPLGFAEVSLYINNSEHTLPIAYDELKITRRLYRSGEGEYRINDTKCRLKDITSLFLDTGIGKEGYSYIGQGRVEELISGGSSIRRQLFDEAAGISAFRNRRDEAERSLERTDENLTRAEDIIAENEARLEPLLEEKTRAEKYLRLRSEIKSMQITSIMLQYEQNAAKREKLETEKADIAADVEAAEAECRRLEAELASAENAVSEAQERLAKLHDERREAEVESEKCKGEIVLTGESIRHNVEALDRLNDQLAENRRSQEEYTERLNNAGLHIDELNGMKRTAEDASAKAGRLRIEQESKLSELNAVIERERAGASELERSYSALREKRAVLVQSIEDGERRITELGAAIEAAKEEGERLRQSADRQGKDSERATAIAEELRTQFAGLSERRTALREKAEAERSALDAAMRDFNAKADRYRLLEDIRKSGDGLYESVKAVTRAASYDESFKGRYLGLVADIINVPSEYETAVEAALGGSMQNIVVPTEQDAKLFIEFLRRERKGQATFLPLTSIKPRFMSNAERKVLNCEGCIGIAADLVDYAPEYTNAVSNLLGRIVIAKDMDAAIPMARAFGYTFKIVTLSGDQLNTGGSITGGSRSRSAGSGLLARSRELEELETFIRETRDPLTKRRDAFSAMLREYEALRNTVTETGDKLRDAEVRAVRAAEEASAANERLNAHTEQVKHQNEELVSTGNELTANRLELSGISAKGSELQSGLGERNNALADAESRLEQLRREIHNRELDENSISLRLEWLNNQLEAAKTEPEECSAKLSDLKIEQEQLLMDCDTAKTERTVLDQRLNASRERRAALSVLIDENIRSTEAVEEEIKRGGTTTQDRRALVNSANETLHTLQNSAAGNELALSRLADDDTFLSKRLWDEYALSFGNAAEFRLEGVTVTQAQKRSEQLREQLLALGDVNTGAIHEYEDVSEKLRELTTQRDDLLSAKKDIVSLMSNITDEMRKRFVEEFGEINVGFGEVFRDMFGGGKASLTLDEGDPLIGNITIEAQPPGKKMQSITLLSGGEKTLTAIAVLFAIMQRHPSQFCVLDEIEAPLDEVNTAGFGRYLRSYCDRTQFIIITHKRGTMEVCDELCGIAMEEKGISKVVPVVLADFEATDSANDKKNS